MHEKGRRITMKRQTQRRLRALVFGVLSILMGSSGRVAAGLFNPQTYTAKNGLRVVVLENHRAPVVTHMVWYKVGTIDDPQGKTGLAHYFEHMMFKGKPGSASESISREVTQVGGQLNAATSFDLTFYYETVAVQHLERMMALESSRLRHLDILEDQAKTEREVVLEERRARIDNNPLGTMGEILNAHYFIRHPYGSPLIGWAEDIRGLTSADLRTFHKTWYHPENAILIIAGDVTLPQVKKLVAKYYEPIPSHYRATRRHLMDPPRRPVKQRLEFQSNHIQSPYLYRKYPAPHFKTQDPQEIYALEVLISYLTETGTGRLYRSLVEEQRIASQVAISFHDFSIDPMPLTLVAQPTPGHTVQELEKAIDEELRKILAGPFLKTEIEKVKDRLLASLIYAKDSAFAGAHHFGFGLCVGKTLEELDNWDAYIEKVTSKDVAAVAQKVFGASSHLTGFLTAQATSKETK